MWNALLNQEFQRDCSSEQWWSLTDFYFQIVRSWIKRWISLLSLFYSLNSFCFLSPNKSHKLLLFHVVNWTNALINFNSVVTKLSVNAALDSCFIQGKLSQRQATKPAVDTTTFALAWQCNILLQNWEIHLSTEQNQMVSILIKKKKKLQFLDIFWITAWGSEVLKYEYLCCTYILTTRKAKIIITGPCVLEKTNLILCIYDCVLRMPTNLTIAKLQITSHYFTKPAWAICIDYFLRLTFFKHIFLTFQFKIIHSSYSPRISRNNSNNNNHLLLIIATSIYYLLWVT